MTDSTDQPKRRRGAQPGNDNARKHGLYTGDLHINPRRVPEIKDLTLVTAEIYRLRQFIARFTPTPEADPDPAADLVTLRALAIASLALTRLYQVQFRIFALISQEQREYNDSLPLDARAERQLDALDLNLRETAEERGLSQAEAENICKVRRFVAAYPDYALKVASEHFFRDAPPPTAG